MREKKSSTTSEINPREKNSSGSQRRLRQEADSQNKTHRGPRENDSHFHGDKEWWQNFFDDEWKRFSFDAHPQELTQKQVDFIIQALNLKPDDQILDLCCGIGRHALELSRRGFAQVTGQDITQTYLDIAATQAKKEGLATEFLNSDMRRIPGYGKLDAIYSWHTSFGYFEDERENEKVIDAIGGALRQGGRFLLDTNNRDWVIRHFAAQTWDGEAPNYILESNHFDLATSTHHGSWTFIGEDGKTSVKRMQLRQYSLHELAELFARYGLRFVHAWGSVNGDEFTMDSRRMIVLFIKGEVSKTSIARELR